jgi:hypothetical protein
MNGGFVDSLEGFGLNAQGTMTVFDGASVLTNAPEDGCARAAARAAYRVGEDL